MQYSILTIVSNYLALMFLFAWVPSVNAALGDPDLNGYVSDYECRDGGPKCDVDVEFYVAKACDYTIKESDGDWPSAGTLSGKHVICIEPGDYTSFTSNKSGNVLALEDSGDGTSGTNGYNVFKYYDPANPTGDEDPWDLAKSKHCLIDRLDIYGDYWIIHRIPFGHTGTNQPYGNRRLGSGEGGHHIFNRILVEGEETLAIGGDGKPDTEARYSGWADDTPNGTSVGHNVIQNSVFRWNGPKPSEESVAIDPYDSDNNFVVNNEIYDYVAHPVQLGGNHNPTQENIVVENNDLYVTSRLYADCSDNTMDPNGSCDATEGPLSRKTTGTSSGPVIIKHNRLWGRHQWAGSSLCCNGDSGQTMGGYSNRPYNMVTGNILMGGPIAINNMASHDSYIGNIFFDYRTWEGTKYAHVLHQWNDPGGGNQENNEWYLNTLIEAGNGSNETSFPGLNTGYNDVRCNVLIDAGPKQSGSAEGTDIANHNAFYNSTLFTFNESADNVDEDVVTRTLGDSDTYSAGQIARFGPYTDCDDPTDVECFLYEAQDSGTTSDQSVSACNTLDCTFQDGDITWEAIRGPFTFWRKLRTTPEQFTIPYAAIGVGAPEYQQCPSSLGSRSSIGINNDTANW
jgi:hypothetical protein